jgi:hypothetical protein
MITIVLPLTQTLAQAQNAPIGSMINIQESINQIMPIVPIVLTLGMMYILYSFLTIFGGTEISRSRYTQELVVGNTVNPGSKSLDLVRNNSERNDKRKKLIAELNARSPVKKVNRVAKEEPSIIGEIKPIENATKEIKI